MWSLVHQSVKYLLSSGWLSMKTEANLLQERIRKFRKIFTKLFSPVLLPLRKDLCSHIKDCKRELFHIVFTTWFDTKSMASIINFSFVLANQQMLMEGILRDATSKNEGSFISFFIRIFNVDERNPSVSFWSGALLVDSEQDDDSFTKSTFLIQPEGKERETC